MGDGIREKKEGDAKFLSRQTFALFPEKKKFQNILCAMGMHSHAEYRFVSRDKTE